jgi:hypothetical protein
MMENMIMTKITAAEARRLAGPTVQERVNAVYPLIRKAAEKGKRTLVLTESFWVDEGYNPTVQYKEAVKLLENDGFTVKFFYEERQFVDMYTIVSW